MANGDRTWTLMHTLFGLVVGIAGFLGWAGYSSLMLSLQEVKIEQKATRAELNSFCTKLAVVEDRQHQRLERERKEYTPMQRWEFK